MSSGTWDRQIVCEAAKPFLEKEWMHFRPEDVQCCPAARLWSNTGFQEQNAFKVVFGVQTVHIEEVIAGIHIYDL